MCSAPAASTFVRGATDVMTFGTAEVGGASKRMGQSAGSAVQGRGMEALTTLAVGAKTPSSPSGAAALVDPTGATQTTKETPASNVAAEAAQRARKAAAMRAGIMSTIGPNLGSIGNTTPKMAFATGMKTALGQ